MRGSGPNSEVTTTLVKFAGGGETSKIRCLHKLELVGFVEKVFFLIEFTKTSALEFAAL